MISGNHIAVSGIECICAAGLNLSECMDSMFSGIRHIAPPSIFISNHRISYPVFEIPENGLFPQSKEIFRTGQLALVAAKGAVEKSGLNKKNLQQKRVGVCIGTTVGSSLNSEKFYQEYLNGKNPDMAPIKRFFNSNPAELIAREFNLSGPCQTIVNACSSGTDAIGIGASWIQAGICDVVIAGGADELCRVTYNGFISLLIVDSSPCRPFDVSRAGLNLGEGASIFVMEAEKSLSERKTTPSAFICGYGSSSDAYHLTAPKPNGAGLKRAITDALESSGVSASDIAFVNAHGTGTENNDKVESMVLDSMLNGVPFHSTKGYTGHTLGASGAIEAAFTSAFLSAGKTPASIGFSKKDPELQSFPQAENKQIDGNFAISESLAFGGNNSVLVIGRGSLL